MFIFKLLHKLRWSLMELSRNCYNLLDGTTTMPHTKYDEKRQTTRGGGGESYGSLTLGMLLYF